MTDQVGQVNRAESAFADDFVGQFHFTLRNLQLQLVQASSLLPLFACCQSLLSRGSVATVVRSVGVDEKLREKLNFLQYICYSAFILTGFSSRIHLGNFGGDFFFFFFSQDFMSSVERILESI